MSFVYQTVETDNTLGFLKGVAKALVDMARELEQRAMMNSRLL